MTDHQAKKCVGCGVPVLYARPIGRRMVFACPFCADQQHFDNKLIQTNYSESERSSLSGSELRSLSGSELRSLSGSERSSLPDATNEKRRPAWDGKNTTITTQRPAR